MRTTKKFCALGPLGSRFAPPQEKCWVREPGWPVRKVSGHHPDKASEGLGFSWCVWLGFKVSDVGSWRMQGLRTNYRVSSV